MDSQSLTTEVIRSVQLAIIVPINLIGNMLVCLVVFRTPQLRTPMNYLLVNLAISDMMVAFFMTTDQFFHHGVRHPSGTTGDYLCKFVTGKLLTWIGSVASVFTLVAVAFERYYAIIYPLQSRAGITKKHFYCIVTACWIFAFCFNIPLAVVRVYNTSINETWYFCESNWSSTDIAVAYSIAWLIFIGVVPMTIMGCLYGRIAQSLWCASNQVGAEDMITSQARLKSRKRVTKMLIVITVIYGVCWMPNLLLNFITYYWSPPGTLSYGYFITEVMVLFNSSVNPFIYSIQSQQFWNGVKGIICCRCCQRSRLIQPAAIHSNSAVQLATIRSASSRPARPVSGAFL